MTEDAKLESYICFNFSRYSLTKFQVHRTKTVAMIKCHRFFFEKDGGRDVISYDNEPKHFFYSCHGTQQAWLISVLFRYRCVLSACFRTPRLSLGHPGSLRPCMILNACVHRRLPCLTPLAEGGGFELATF